MSRAMPPMIDARLPLTFGREDAAGPADALLIEGEGAAAATRDYFTAAAETGHPANCACCLPRNAAGMALSRLLLARARAHGARFTQVIAVTHTEGGRAAVIQALEQDPLASACFRLR